MKEYPIIMQPESVRAILDGSKTQTRRLVTPQPIFSETTPPRFPKPGTFYLCQDMFPTDPGPAGFVIAYAESRGTVHCMGQKAFVENHSPYGQIGDRLWVRETWAVREDEDGERPCNLPGKCGDPELDQTIWYAADGTQLPHPEAPPACTRGKWRPSIFMPRWASRVTLEVVNVRVERLQQITNDDARAEGVVGVDWGGGGDYGFDGNYLTPYEAMWNKINRKRAPWESNPWVWVIEFRRLP